MRPQLAFLFALSLFLAVRGLSASASKPNLVFIMADDQGIGEVGVYGSKVVPTPNIDRLAAEGMKFTRAYSGSAVCAPTRAVLMTGLHTGHATRRANMSKDGLIPLRAEDITVARKLKEAGYATGGFGKWGLGNPGTTGIPEKHGFDLWYGYYDQVHAHSFFPTYLVRNSVEEKLAGNRPAGTKLGKGEGSDYSVDLILKETLGFIEANKDRPFFCYAAWTLPHGDFEVPAIAPEFAAKPWPENVKAHATMLQRLDRDVGTLLAKLSALGIERNTLVIYTSDNGAAGPGGAFFGSSGGLRGAKRALHEGGIRAPFLARWPGRIPAGSTSDLLTSHVDWMATAGELGGVQPPRTDGISLAPTLLGKPQLAKHEHLYWEIYEGPVPFQQAVRLGDWKGYRTALRGPLQLHHLASDPAEQTDVAAQHRDIVTKIEAIMAAEHVASPHWEPPELPQAAKKKSRAKDK
jgi:arylsulfatase A-like enzyme